MGAGAGDDVGGGTCFLGRPRGLADFCLTAGMAGLFGEVGRGGGAGLAGGLLVLVFGGAGGEVGLGGLAVAAAAADTTAPAPPPGLVPPPPPLKLAIGLAGTVQCSNPSLLVTPLFITTTQIPKKKNKQKHTRSRGRCLSLSPSPSLRLTLLALLSSIFCPDLLFTHPKVRSFRSSSPLLFLLAFLSLFCSSSALFLPLCQMCNSSPYKRNARFTERGLGNPQHAPDSIRHVLFKRRFKSHGPAFAHVCGIFDPSHRPKRPA